MKVCAVRFFFILIEKQTKADQREHRTVNITNSGFRQEAKKEETMKRRNAECGKLRRPIKRNKIAEGMYGR